MFPRTRSAALGAALLALLVSGCTGDEHSSAQKLPSGKEIRVEGIGIVSFDEGTAVMLKYYTDLDASDTQGLRSEANEIWPQLRRVADTTSLRLAVIQAKVVRKRILGNLITISETRNSVWQKQDSGEWHFVGGEPNEDASGT
jgi:hypothetical protein